MRDRTLLDPNLRALVVEDDTVTREFLADALAQAGWAVSVAATLAVAVRILREWTPRLVLSDVRLPDGDAFRLSAEFSLGNSAGKHEPYAIALSAEVDPALRARLMAAGYDLSLIHI